MTRSKFRLLMLGTALTLSMSLPATFAAAQDTAADEPTEVVVTGTRTARRSKLETLAPVDVIKADTLQAQGSSELAEGLSRLAPSITFQRPAVTDGTDSVRPASLRGLSPDQTLVLLNGKRRHASSLVNINGSVGRGSAAVDLNTIPETALGSVEVLRDGASAQYGSDAIAGVMNLRLREASSGGSLGLSFGYYDTKVETANTSYDAKDGETTTVSGWIGLPLFSDGFLTLSGEIKDRKPTSRGGLDTRITPAAVKSRYGDPQERAVTLFANAGKPINDVWSAYGWASYQNRRDDSAANYRQPANAGNVLAIYPNGFLPIIQAHTKDYSLTGGLKGIIGGWDSDFSLSYGNNKLSYATVNSVNASYGTASKTWFYSGYLQYGQTLLNASFSKPYEVSWLAAPLDVAFGFEARKETYKIGQGETQSWALGPIAAQQGAQGFPGLFPQNEADVDRNNFGAYLDFETKLTDKLSAGVAVRYEDYSDFGDNVSAKLSGRYDFTDSFAIRGSASNGFRAPSLQQQYFSSTATNFVSGVPLLITTFPATSNVAKALGAAPLEAETSENLALGFVFHKGPFDITVDAYNIKIEDRIVLTENLIGKSGPTITNQGIYNLLAPFGVDAARFFMNGVDTTTKGIDIVANYRLNTDSFGDYTFSLAANHGETEIDRFPANNTLSSLPVPPALFARVNQNLLTTSTPEDKFNASVDWKLGGWGASINAVHYSSILSAQTNAVYDFETGDKTVVNVSANYRFANKVVWSVGVDNIGDVYPDPTPITTLAGTLTPTATTAYNGGAGFSPRSPFGFNGRFLYTRITKSW
ncbi:TonB-dependent siderophore receptor [Asticcacaulis sp. YBE204]|uniref:TonB-dependent receptor plug domain-containing protein n=1 Tax=Asticcacaulis sp. YBE204 TaxID=1282363 RepID=UPI00040D94DE|nr:TonB-dependent receptor [Asticcacaulis sp. YBE204]